jgi:hypothetical protein
MLAGGPTSVITNWVNPFPECSLRLVRVLRYLVQQLDQSVVAESGLEGMRRALTLIVGTAIAGYLVLLADTLDLAQAAQTAGLGFCGVEYPGYGLSKTWPVTQKNIEKAVLVDASSSSSLASQITQPTWVVHGTRDEIIPLMQPGVLDEMLRFAAAP